ncbi:MAG: solute:sodium symporter family transporter [Thermoguttaceae bacterium]|nr:solute:sodium symporter family transporter [Thermoguttaceae bacterium]MDW8078601.1 solute:sodium symporter family transporter [Thermoguttaceae bacterium]
MAPNDFALTTLDGILFAAYVLGVVLFAVFMSRREKTSEDYFLAGRGLTWFLIGVSLIASNISTEHFVGMAGAGFATGLAIACYEWTAAIAIVIVGLFLLPRFLARGIYTIPQFLEFRYSAGARGLMAFYIMAAYIFVIISAVLYAGALGLDTIFGASVKEWYQNTPWLHQLQLERWLGANWVIIAAVWTIGLLAGCYTVWGGLKAVVWADLINGLALIMGGALITVLAFSALVEQLGGGSLAKGITEFFARAGDKLSAVKPWDHPEVPWIAVFIGGLWIPQFYYWGLNQFITQRALGARSVAQGQKGMVFAAFLKILMPFIIVFPGIIAFELYSAQVKEADRAFPHLVRTILGPGFRGLMLAAMFGAVMSSLDSMLNSASTIVTVDLYKRYLRPGASDRALLVIGRILTAIFVILACLWAPQLGWIAGGKGVFDYIQRTWGFITPAIVTVFFFGLSFSRVSAQGAVGALLLGPAFYMWCLKTMPEVAFLHHMAFTFVVLSFYLLAVSLLTPVREEEVRPGVTELPSPWGAIERPRGFLRGVVVPILTIAIGTYWMSVALFDFSWLILVRIFHNWQLERLPDWLPFVTTFVPVAIYALVGLWLLHLPFPQVRYILPSYARPSVGVFRPLWAIVGTFVLAVLVGLHVYLFAIFNLKPSAQAAEASDQGASFGAIYRQLWDQEVVVDIPVVMPADPERQPLVHLGHLQVAMMPIKLRMAPLMMAGIAGALFFLGSLLLWAIGCRPGITVKPGVTIDLRPSPSAAIFGLLAIVLVFVVYYRFF